MPVVLGLSLGGMIAQEVSQSRRIAKTVRRGRLVVVPGGSHLWVLKQPADAGGIIRQFLLES